MHIREEAQGGLQVCFFVFLCAVCFGERRLARIFDFDIFGQAVYPNVHVHIYLYITSRHWTQNQWVAAFFFQNKKNEKTFSMHRAFFSIQ